MLTVDWDPDKPHPYRPKTWGWDPPAPEMLDQRPCQVCTGSEATRPHLDWDRQAIYGEGLSTGISTSG